MNDHLDHVDNEDNEDEYNDEFGFFEDESNRDQSEEEYVEDVPPTSIIKATLQNISSYWSDHFYTDSNNIIHGFQAPSQHRTINLHIKDLNDLCYTWLMDLEKCDEDTDTHWTSTLLAQLIKAPFLPKQTAKEFPRRLPVKFSDKQAENYFTSNSLGAAGKKITPFYHIHS